MRGQRSDQKGSFGGRFEEIVKHFPHDLPQRPKPIDKRELQHKRDIHALLFERAWNVGGKKPDKS